MSAFDTGSVMNPPVLIEADHVSVTVGWDAMPEAKAYEIEISEGNPTGEWRSLSNKLTSTFVRKKNLAFDIDYFFRIRYTGDSETWGNFSDASNAFRVVPEACQMMNPPVVAQKDGVSVSLTWDEVQEAEGYKLRFREDKTSTWNEVASVIKGNKVRKKGLQQGARYFFSVKPVGGGENAFSAASLPAVIPSLSAFMSRMLPNQILSKATQGLVSTSETLAGKVVGIYFSAHWCGPCRNFTPQLAQLYNECKRLGKDFEVLFCSADSDEDEFLGYFQKEMPWYAVPYDDPTREQIQSTFQVNGIPKLSILAPSGRFIVENAAGQALSPSTVDAWIQRAASM